MVDWSTIERWNATAMRSVGEDLDKQQKKLQGTEAELRDATTPNHWSGDGADAARQSLDGIEQGIHNRVAEYAALGVVVDDVAERIAQVKDAMDATRDAAKANQLQITDDGKVMAQPFVDMSPEAIQTRAEAITALEERVGHIVKTGLEIDNDLTDVMLAVTEGRIDDDGATTMAAAADAGLDAVASSVVDLPPKNASPAETKEWWDSLSKDERQWLVRERPELLGSRDGVPATYRDQANRMLLQQEKQDLIDRRDDLQDSFDRGGTSAAHEAWLEGRIAELDGMLDGIGVLEKTLASTDGMPANQRHYLLHIEGDEAGQAIVALGNPDTASNTATYVPGMNTSLDRVGNDLARIDAMHGDAMKEGAENTSVIMWAGYDAPQGMDQAMRETYADRAQDDLTDFQQGLRATHEGSERSVNSMVSHSYGNVVTGQAASHHDLDVDRMVMVGSPGSGDGVDSVRDLGMQSEDVYAVTDGSDFIRASPEFVHGTQPIEPSFGAQVFESESGTSNPVTSHGAYWDQQNPARQNIARIIAGEEPR